MLLLPGNNILRAATSTYMANYVSKVLKCGNNTYPTTMHVLSAAIAHLGKLTQAQKVYRAPGRALPGDFWTPTKSGVPGIIEAGCMSCSVHKEQAMHYARRGTARLLFEVELGLISRGADIGAWGLSQYDSEAEVLMPPVTALQIMRAYVDVDVVVVVLQPTIRGDVKFVKTGRDDEEIAAHARSLRRKQQLQSFIGKVRNQKRVEHRDKRERAAQAMMDLSLKTAMFEHSKTRGELALCKKAELDAAKRALELEKATGDTSPENARKLKELHSQIQNLEEEADHAQKEADKMAKEVEAIRKKEAMLQEQLKKSRDDMKDALAKQKELEKAALAKSMSSADEEAVRIQEVCHTLERDILAASNATALSTDQRISGIMRVVELLEQNPQVLQVLSLGCGALAVLTDAHNDRIVAQEVAEAAFTSPVVETTIAAGAVLPLMMRGGVQQTIRNLASADNEELVQRIRELGGSSYLSV